MNLTADNYIYSMKGKIKNALLRVWYWYVSTVDKEGDVTFMNYGYAKKDHKIKLNEQDKKNRYSAQLYDFVATGVDIKGKDVLEVGCGRGGGISYIQRYLTPKSVTGLDLNRKAIEFCKRNYANQSINFVQGNAEELPFEDNSFDVVINVESSHRYNQMEKFLNEVYRVLKPGGHVLFADFRPDNELDMLKQQFENSNFKRLRDEVITPNVLEALDLMSEERVELIKKLSPKIFHGLGKQFAATEGTPTYNKFASQRFEYLYHVHEKVEA